MNEIYLLQNQDKLFLSKQNEWVDGRDPAALYKARHKDEALNQLFEVNAKDYSQRIHVLNCPVKSNGLPQIDPDDLPPRMETDESEHRNAESQAEERNGDQPEQAQGELRAEGA